VKKLAILKVQRMIFTAFTLVTFFLLIFRLESGDARGQNIERNVFVGWSDPKHHFGHGTVPKSGVAPAQPGVLPASKLTVAPSATSCSLGTCSIAKVTARVTRMVICVFHAPVTLPALQMAIAALEIVMPHISKRPRK
jgi:hypothetical protein